MMYLFLLSGNAISLAACPIRRLEAQRSLTADATSEVVAWFVDGSSEHLARFTSPHNEEMAREFISTLIEGVIDRASRGIGALWVDAIIAEVEAEYQSEPLELTGEEVLERAA